VSEYQYYDFRAMDRALTKTEVAELRSISTRAVITSTSFTNHYEWGDLKADPLKLLEKYFDAFVYVANWGTREFSLRLPQELIDYESFRTMLPGEAAQVRKAGSFVIVAFERESELDDWDDGTGWMGSLMSLRGDLLRGDLRCLYLGWLFCLQNGEFTEADTEPPVPAGLGELSAPLHSLIEFLEIDEDLVEIAAAASAALDAGPCRKELDAWIRSLPQDEKDDLLVSAVSEPSERWKNDLLRRFQRQNAAYTSSETSSVQRRSAGDLLAAVHARAEERARILSAKRAEEAAQKKAEDEAKRVRYLDQLEKRERDVWAQIAAQIQKRQPNEYDKAVILLTDLRAVADRRGRVSEFQSALETLRQAHSSKLSFLRRLEKAKL
jgi:nitrite reductase/ring-hydroxylating ferredoxin subunit